MFIKTKLIVCLGVLGLGASLQAGTSFSQLNFTNEVSGIQDGSYWISPYSGTLAGTTLNLYCDDFNDQVSANSSFNVYTTALGASAATLDADTRYGLKDAPNSQTAVPAGTQLYEEMAWLTTQMMASGVSNSNKTALQEAIWSLTNDASGPDGASPHSSSGNTGTASAGDTGTAQSYSQWVTDATADYNKTVSGYATLVVSDWFILTATDAAGCTLGATGTTGCTPGNTGSTTANTQEFLTYDSSGLPVSTTTATATPEPSTFVLIGSVLMAGAFFGRRRMTVKAN